MRSAQHATATMISFVMGYSMACFAKVIFTMNRKKKVKKPGAISGKRMRGGNYNTLPPHPT
jgi:hypothetical protein